jgi:glucose-6-phosphate isomerase
LDNLPDSFADQFNRVNQEITKIEAGEIKNPDENRKVTHFTDRPNYLTSSLFSDAEKFAKEVRDGKIKNKNGQPFTSFVVNGIGGSALGPQLMNFAINGPYWNELSQTKRQNGLKIYFTDNTDSSGITDVLEVVDIETTLIINISKSGGTKETYNNMISFEAAYQKAGLNFADYAIAITMESSKLDQKAKKENWLKVFPLADSIGGRTSETSIVGHLPATLTGIDFGAFLKGAIVMDEMTRQPDFNQNPAYMLATAWFATGKGKGDKNMVIVPYSDRLLMLSRYMQQLVMESIGKRLDLDGNIVEQGLNVFGNKGGTDAHAFIQQLNDGRNDFFITFIEVLKDRKVLPCDNGCSMGDYLHSFKGGLSNALQANQREVIDITIDDIDPFHLGMIIALYERTVAVYAEMVNINAFHQPGVEAYKHAGNKLLAFYETLYQFIESHQGFTGTAQEIANQINCSENVSDIEGILIKITMNHDSVEKSWDSNAKQWIYSIN